MNCTAEEVALASKALEDGLMEVTLSVPQISSQTCIRDVEAALLSLDHVVRARANLSLRRVVVNWTADADQVPDLPRALAAAGYSANLVAESIDTEDPVAAYLARALAVAGFCSMNIMLLSVSVWSGADSDIRYAFHLISGVLALPAVLYSGRIFYISAWGVLRSGHLNMDVPISVGVILSFMLSVFDGLSNAPLTYFEASTSLLFVLLAGRLLDHSMRSRAKSAAAGLTQLMPRGADMIAPDGSTRQILLSEVRPGMKLLITTGSRFPVDGVVEQGCSEVDSSVISGETVWRSVSAGSEVRAGEMNQGGPLRLAATATADKSLLSEMAGMLRAAEGDRSLYRHLADRAASIYAPIVHSLSALAFFSWLSVTGDVHKSMSIAIAVLVITCPCALGLAVPMVQVVLARRLFSQGVIATDGSAFERLAKIDTVVFDKTGTLTSAEPRMIARAAFTGHYAAVAGSLARLSRHPVCNALTKEHESKSLPVIVLDKVTETAGLGLEGAIGSDLYRLGRPAWASGGADGSSDSMSVALSRNGVKVAEFAFAESITPGARSLVKWLKSQNLSVHMLTGDCKAAASMIASDLGMVNFHAELLPAQKVSAIEVLRAQGRKVLMIGDGINDAAAMRAALVSIAPSSATDLGRSAADLLLLDSDLSVITECINSARRANTLVKQNFLLAALYNLTAIPVAFSGGVTPMMAAVAMSTSSVLVVLNALRLAPSRNVSRKVIERGFPEEANA